MLKVFCGYFALPSQSETEADFDCPLVVLRRPRQLGPPAPRSISLAARNAHFRVDGRYNSPKRINWAQVRNMFCLAGLGTGQASDTKQNVRHLLSG